MNHGESLAAPVDTWIEVGDGRLFAQVTGSGQPLLLIHGWAMDRRIFTLQVPALSQEMRVITFDRRGFGRSEAPPGLNRELDDIDGLLDELVGEPVHLLGMSQGGRIALRYAITRPHRLRSLILQGALVDGLPADDTDNERIPVGEYAALMRQGNIGEIRRHWRQHPMMDVGKNDVANNALLEAMLQDYSGADLLDYGSESYSFPGNVLDAAAKLSLPALILTGARETAARSRHAATLAATIPGALEVVLEESGHLSNLAEPDVYNQAVIAFCRDVESRYRESGRGADD